MELTLLIPVVLGVIIGIFYLYSSQYDYDEYKYQCHQCKKRFHKEDLEIKGWHLKEWVCPNCKTP